MITENDLKLICNYSEQKIYNAVSQFSYLSFESTNDEEMKLKQKQTNRNIIINGLLDESEEPFESDFQNISDQFNTISTISPKIYSVNVVGTKYNKIVDIYTKVMNELEISTSSKVNKLQLNNRSLIDSILSRISVLKYMVAANGRIGEANTIICGIDAYNELIKTEKGIIKNDGICKFNIFNMDVISSDLISKNKFIVTRLENRILSGLNVINSVESNMFFIFKTICWENNMCWFEI